MLDLSYCKTVDDVGSEGPMEADALKEALRELGKPMNIEIAKMLAKTRRHVGSNAEAIRRVRRQLLRYE